MILMINAAGIEDGYYDQRRFIPYGTSVLVSYLRKRGFKVSHYDLRNTLPIYPLQYLQEDDFQRWLLAGRQTDALKRYLDCCFKALPCLSGIKLVGISVMGFVNYPYALALCKQIKRQFPQLPICLGGPFITIKDLTMPGYVDFFVKGRGEIPLENLARHFACGAALDYGMRGLCFRRGERFIDNGKRNAPADLEESPDFSDFDLERYRLDGGVSRRNISRRLIIRKRLMSLPSRSRPFFMIPYRMSIGCSNKCTFCTGCLVDDLLFKGLEKVVSEIKELYRRYDNAVIVFCDSSINSSHVFLSKVLDAFLKENFKFPSMMNAKFDSMSFELLEKIAAVGCEYIFWGLESAAQNMVDIYAKEFDIQKAEGILEKASRLGIVSECSFMFGGPGERFENFAVSERFIGRHIRDNNIFFTFYRFKLEKDTVIFKHPERFGIEIMSRDQPLKFLSRQEYPWKERDMDMVEFLERQKAFKSKIVLIENKFIITRLCMELKINNPVFVSIALGCYRGYKWLADKLLLLPLPKRSLKNILLRFKHRKI